MWVWSTEGPGQVPYVHVVMAELHRRGYNPTYVYGYFSPAGSIVAPSGVLNTGTDQVCNSKVRVLHVMLGLEQIVIGILCYGSWSACDHSTFMITYSHGDKMPIVGNTHHLRSASCKQ